MISIKITRKYYNRTTDIAHLLAYPTQKIFGGMGGAPVRIQKGYDIHKDNYISQ